MPGKQPPHRHQHRNANGRPQPERHGGGAPVPTRNAERDRRAHRGGLVRCPGPGGGERCADDAKVMPGKMCQGCRAVVGSRNAQARKGKG